MIPRREWQFLRDRRGHIMSGASSGYEVVKRCQFKVSGSDNLPRICGEPMKYSVKRKTWYCSKHGDED